MHKRTAAPKLAQGTIAGLVVGVSLLLLSMTGPETASAATLAGVPNPLANDSGNFGASLDVDGTTLVVGAPDSDPPGEEEAVEPGVAHVYRRNGSVWTLSQTLKAPDADDFHQDFGASVAISGSIIVVGAPGRNIFDGGQNLQDAGEVFIFRESNGQFVLEAQIKNPTPAGADKFGYVVATDGQTVVASAKSDRTYTSQGVAWVIEHDGSAWRPVAELLDDNPDSYDSFGDALAVRGNDILVGYPRHDAARGRVLAFERIFGNWSKIQTLNAPLPDRLSLFGTSISIHGDDAAVGAPKQNPIGGPGSAPKGVVYLLHRNEIGWFVQSMVEYPRENRDEFGRTVALSADALLVGSPANSGVSYGEAYLLRRQGTTFGPPLSLRSGATGPDAFSESVRLSTWGPILGAPRVNLTTLGAGPGTPGAIYLGRSELLDEVFAHGFE